MNDFLKTMSQLGVESILPETEMTLEQEMAEEIAMEAELDEAYEHMEFSNIVASTSQAEAMLTAMAEREIGLESNVGRNATDIYKEFGLEAIKDVVARKAYSAVSSLKALINTCISWLKQLIGIEVSAKKVFSGIAKKAKAMDKNLRKVVSKVNEKLKRDMPKYAIIIDKILAAYEDSVKHVSEKRLNEADINTYKGTKDFTSKTTHYDKADESLTKKLEKIDDLYDKDDTDEYEGTACYNHIIKSVSTLNSRLQKRKSEDKIKGINDRIKDLEKLRKNLDKDNTVKNADGLSKMINLEIKVLTKIANYRKKTLKLFVRVADDCLTMGKSIYAALV